MATCFDPYFTHFRLNLGFGLRDFHEVSTSHFLCPRYKRVSSVALEQYRRAHYLGNKVFSPLYLRVESRDFPENSYLELPLHALETQ